jgi:hypothetical protein
MRAKAGTVWSMAFPRAFCRDCPSAWPRVNPVALLRAERFSAISG